MSARARRGPPAPEDIPVFMIRFTESIVDTLAARAKDFLDRFPRTRSLDEREKTALAYALVGDLIASPIPPPFDAPIDVAVSTRIRELLPEMERYRHMYARAAEAFPLLELLPTYTIVTLATIREKELRSQ